MGNDCITHRIKKELSICQSSLCLDLVSFPVLSQIKPQAPGCSQREAQKVFAALGARAEYYPASDRLSPTGQWVPPAGLFSEGPDYILSLGADYPRSRPTHI